MTERKVRLPYPGDIRAIINRNRLIFIQFLTWSHPQWQTVGCNMQFSPIEWALWLQLVGEFHIEGIALSESIVEETWRGIAGDVAIKSWKAGAHIGGQDGTNTRNSRLQGDNLLTKTYFEMLTLNQTVRRLRIKSFLVNSDGLHIKIRYFTAEKSLLSKLNTFSTAGLLRAP